MDPGERQSKSPVLVMRSRRVISRSLFWAGTIKHLFDDAEGAWA
jgi:hypothetical protein